MNFGDIKKEAQKSVEECKQRVLNDLLGRLSHDEMSFFFKLYPSYPKLDDKEFWDAVDIIDRTLVKHFQEEKP